MKLPGMGKDPLMHNQGYQTMIRIGISGIPIITYLMVLISG